VESADIDETPLPGESPPDMVMRLAQGKARVVARRCAERSDDDDRAGNVLVIGADTTVDVDGESLGKPVDLAEAREMLQRLSGRDHSVSTGFAVVGEMGGVSVDEVRGCETTVSFCALSDDDIEWYLQTGEFAGKAGAYAIQGFASVFVERIDGAYANVVGLPVAALDRVLTELGWPLRSFQAMAVDR